jgi:hypothetical protein
MLSTLAVSSGSLQGCSRSGSFRGRQTGAPRRGRSHLAVDAFFVKWCKHSPGDRVMALVHFGGPHTLGRLVARPSPPRPVDQAWVNYRSSVASWRQHLASEIAAAQAEIRGPHRTPKEVATTLIGLSMAANQEIQLLEDPSAPARAQKQCVTQPVSTDKPCDSCWLAEVIRTAAGYLWVGASGCHPDRWVRASSDPQQLAALETRTQTRPLPGYARGHECTSRGRRWPLHSSGTNPWACHISMISRTSVVMVQYSSWVRRKRSVHASASALSAQRRIA